MRKRLSRGEFHQRHKPVIDLAMQKLSMAEIAKKTGKSKSMVSFTITTARQRGIKIPYKTMQKRNHQIVRVNLLKKVRGLLGENIKRINQKKLNSLLEGGATVDVVAKELSDQLNCTFKKAYPIAQAMYQAHKLK